MKLQINVPVSGLDLAGLLHGEEGLFLCQNRGQDYIAVAKAGHSIAYGPTPIGRKKAKASVGKLTGGFCFDRAPASRLVSGLSWNNLQLILGPEPWFVTKISNSTEFAEFTGK